MPWPDELSETAKEGGLAETDSGALMIDILLSNFIVLLFAILLGLIPFLRLPAPDLGVNAMLIGAMGAYCRQNGVSFAAYLAGVLLRGVTEMTALVLARAAGLHANRAIDEAWLCRSEKSSVNRAVLDNSGLYARLIAPLLVILAWIEAFVKHRSFLCSSCDALSKGSRDVKHC